MQEILLKIGCKKVMIDELRHANKYNFLIHNSK